MSPIEFEIVTLVVGQMAANCYLLIDKKKRETLIVDPGDAPEYITDKITQLDCNPKMILATHGHFDHIMGAFALQQAYTIPFYIHKEDAFLVERMSESAQHFLETKIVDPPPVVNQTFVDKMTVNIGTAVFTVMHTPGHTPGSICLFNKKENSLFTGDTIFAGGAVGRTDFSYSEPKKLVSSISSILELPENTELYPGHGEKTTVRKERMHHIQS
ncbi:hypothetical protein A3A64_02370 [Candidatus Gottesmanbacteria bacterium RIFCSPLOWO2_01_FULL_48_11]|uniref:Beta-lactamase domain protein n=3 Tax=Candidatus Gottesmaniibacteriota TaxID=1752720 RepID=A0A0G1XN13_9BACT|nr:MAG: Beta-lactamase domain protein [Candidatus Gottesmanbacteria bacterium GW2011_GWA2_47_9]KKU95710.1 MAG: Beta-lactamase domain protein [Candidatus Gottesmanbacteria bacterium GW2011_GWA1_48_13]OGG28279.1 MAG: hypothetical protein A3A64_02370 [Candidatus Gottesmanbacteria bacterium RIFCSPLOWO2_01_FULL_48_11]